VTFRAIPLKLDQGKIQELEGELLKLKYSNKTRKVTLRFIFPIIIIFIIIIGIIIKLNADSWTNEDKKDNLKQQYVKVKSFGAKGDGITNDTVSLQKAINYASDKKKVKVILPKGNYVVDFLIIPKNIYLEGNREASIVASKKRYSSFISISGENIELHGININGKNRRSIGLNIMQNSNNIRIYGCYIGNINSTYLETTAGIKIEGNTKDILIQNNIINRISNTPNGVEGDSAGTSRGIWIRRSSKEVEPLKIKIHKNTIRNIQTREDGDGIAVQGWHRNVDVTISNNFFESCAKRAIKIMSPGVLIKNNKIINSYTHEVDYKKVMYSFISIYASNVVVDGNQMIGGNGYSGIDVGTDLMETPKRIKITNNKIIFSPTGIKTFLGGIAMYTSVKDVYIAGNTIENTNYGIQIRKQLKGCIITSNSINNASERGIYISNYNYINISDVVIFKNKIHSTKETILLRAGEAIVTGNKGKTSSKTWKEITINNEVNSLLRSERPTNYFPKPSEFYRGIVITLQNNKKENTSYKCVPYTNTKKYKWEKINKE